MIVSNYDSLPRIFQGPLHSMCVTIIGNKATISGSYSPNHQKGMPTGIANNHAASFPICLLQKNVINKVTTTRCVLYGLLSLSSKNKYNAVSIAASEGAHNKLSPLLSSSNHPIVSIVVNVSPRQYPIQGSSSSDIYVAPFLKGTNCGGSSPLVIPPRLFPLDITSIPAFIVIVPTM